MLGFLTRRVSLLAGVGAAVVAAAGAYAVALAVTHMAAVSLALAAVVFLAGAQAASMVRTGRAVRELRGAQEALRETVKLDALEALREATVKAALESLKETSEANKEQSGVEQFVLREELERLEKRLSLLERKVVQQSIRLADQGGAPDS